MVYVQDIDGSPLMPTTRYGKVRRLLKANKATVISLCPFTIKLLYKTSDYKQEIVLGVDAGTKHVGLSATTKSKELYASEVILRSDVVDLLSTRRELRRTRRSRLRYRKPRFMNRIKSKKDRWIAPSVYHKIDSHIRIIGFVYSILPVSKLIVEVAQFDTQMRLRISLRAIFCLGLSLFLSSCGSRRQVSEASIDSRLISRIETMINEVIDRKMVEIKTSDLNADIVITERKFDTDKDIDPATGERPVSSVTDAHIVIGRRDSTVTTDSLGVDKTITGIEDIDKKTDIKHKDIDDKEESRWPMAIIFMSILGILVVLFVLLKRFGLIK